MAYNMENYVVKYNKMFNCNCDAEKFGRFNGLCKSNLKDLQTYQIVKTALEIEGHFCYTIERTHA